MGGRVAKFGGFKTFGPNHLLAEIDCSDMRQQFILDGVLGGYAKTTTRLRWRAERCGKAAPKALAGV
jgi:hypothetical protein